MACSNPNMTTGMEGDRQKKTGDKVRQGLWGVWGHSALGLLSSLLAAETEPAWLAWVLQVSGCTCPWGAG